MRLPLRTESPSEDSAPPSPRVNAPVSVATNVGSAAISAALRRFTVGPVSAPASGVRPSVALSSTKIPPAILADRKALASPSAILEPVNVQILLLVLVRVPKPVIRFGSPSRMASSRLSIRVRSKAASPAPPSTRWLFARSNAASLISA
ncbi:Uncharacterised protein [Yersinia pseudotuberculosis]|nr:Uncharacterised protein [Yersinia pseudotuberculosis]